MKTCEITGRIEGPAADDVIRCRVCERGELGERKVYRLATPAVVLGNVMLVPLGLALVVWIVGMLVVAVSARPGPIEKDKQVREAALAALVDVAGLTELEADNFLADRYYELPVRYYTDDFAGVRERMYEVRETWDRHELPRGGSVWLRGHAMQWAAEAVMVPAVVLAAVGAMLVGRRRMLVCSVCRAATPMG